MPRKLKGIRRSRRGWQAYVKVRGTTYAKSFPIETPAAVMRAWRDQQTDRQGGAAAGSFGADVADYLSRVSAMPSYAQRAAHLALWTAALGAARPRRTITPTEIDRAI
jgi:hypothetical protein